MIPAYVVFQAGTDLLASFVADAVPGPAAAPLSALARLGPEAILLFLFPGVLFSIVHETSVGENELPDWPDYWEIGARLANSLWLLVAGAIFAAPVALALRLAGCDSLAMLRGGAGARCWTAFAVAAALGTLLAIFAFGATGAYESGWLSFRLDLHLEALLRLRARVLPTWLALVALFAAAEILSLLLRPIPLLGLVADHALSAYALFTGAHLVGLLFRRGRAILDPLYLGAPAR